MIDTRKKKCRFPFFLFDCMLEATVGKYILLGTTSRCNGRHPANSKGWAVQFLGEAAWKWRKEMFSKAREIEDALSTHLKGNGEGETVKLSLC